jgi:hypothetical protein|mmetsp:Transcript_32076/g.57998  ORF Transcript_32076/g.57998 Transcript_32076/m.57998 type:complete len:102 (+) Transcript_32076:589-894(+)
MFGRFYLQPFILATGKWTQIESISGALCSATLCFLKSILVHDPLVKRHGLAAAIGAHVYKQRACGANRRKAVNELASLAFARKVAISFECLDLRASKASTS